MMSRTDFNGDAIRYNFVILAFLLLCPGIQQSPPSPAIHLFP